MCTVVVLQVVPLHTNSQAVGTQQTPTQTDHLTMTLCVDTAKSNYITTHQPKYHRDKYLKCMKEHEYFKKTLFVILRQHTEHSNAAAFAGWVLYSINK
jgi:hypothetical protein